MSMDFPSSPVNGQTTTDGRYYFDSSVGSSGAWRSTPLPVGGLPAGSIMAWGTNTPPANWLLADGSAVSRSVYSSLFAVIGTQYGAGNGTTTFNLPDLRGRVPVGRNGGTFGTLGATGGAETHTLTEAQMPSHTHVQNPHNHNFLYNGTEYGSWTYGTAFGSNLGFVAGNAAGASTGIANKTATNQNTGGSQAHNNLQPYQVVNYIIKATAGWTAGDSELATRLGVVETANATTNRAGLVPAVPASVVVASGSGSSNSFGVVSFTGATLVSLNNVFSSAYENYRIILRFNATTAGTGTIFRLRAGGADNTSALYDRQGAFQNGTGAVTSLGAINETRWSAVDLDDVNNMLSLDLSRPFVADRTSGVFQSRGYISSTTAYMGSLFHKVSSSYDGFSFGPTSGNITGTIQVYGYR